MPHIDLPPKRFLSLRDVEVEYPLSRRTLQTLIAEGRLGAFRIGRKLIVKREDLERLLTSHPASANLDQIVEEVLGELGGAK
jgi:excisionase family DNA binding protein